MYNKRFCLLHSCIFDTHDCEKFIVFLKYSFHRYCLPENRTSTLLKVFRNSGHIKNDKAMEYLFLVLENYSQVQCSLSLSEAKFQKGNFPLVIFTLREVRPASENRV